MFKKLRTVIFRTEDLAATKEWYSGILGSKPYFDQEYYVGFDINGYELGLDPHGEKTDGRNQTVAYWAVDDLPGCIEKLISAGAELMSPLQDVGEGIRVATLRDPWGNAIGMIEGADGPIT